MGMVYARMARNDKIQKRINYIKSIYPQFFEKLGFEYLTKHSDNEGAFCCLKF